MPGNQRGPALGGPTPGTARPGSSAAEGPAPGLANSGWVSGGFAAGASPTLSEGLRLAS